MDSATDKASGSLSPTTDNEVNDHTSSLAPLAPYPGLAGGEAVVYGLRIASPKLIRTDVDPKDKEEAIDSAKNVAEGNSASAAEHTKNKGTPHGSNSLDSALSGGPGAATFEVDEALVSTLLEALGRQHRALIAELNSLSDVVSTEALMGVCNLAEAATTLEDLFRRIDLLHAKVEYLNSFVVQPLTASVKSIHAPRDLKGKALNVLKSFSLLKSAATKIGGSTDEEEAEAMWGRIPPFVLIGGPVGVSASAPIGSIVNGAVASGTHDDDGGSNNTSGGGKKKPNAPFGSPFPAQGSPSSSPQGSPAAHPLTLAANLSLLQPLTSMARSAAVGGVRSTSAGVVTEGDGRAAPEPSSSSSVSKRSYFKKDYTAEAASPAGAGEGPSGSSSSAAEGHHNVPSAAVASRNPQEFREEIVSNSVFYFDQSTANRYT